MLSGYCRQGGIKMKNDYIKIRINSDEKEKYILKTKDMNTTISNDLYNHILEVNNGHSTAKENNRILYQNWKTVYNILSNVEFEGKTELLISLGEIESCHS